MDRELLSLTKEIASKKGHDPALCNPDRCSCLQTAKRYLNILNELQPKEGTK